MIKTQTSEFYQIQEDTLLTPVIDFIKRPLRDIIHVIQAPTNMGKTHYTFTSYIPELYNQGNQLFTYVAPTTDIITQVYKDAEKCAKQIGGKVVTDFDKLEEVLASGEPVIWLTTTNGFCFDGEKANAVLNVIKKYKSAIIVDEIHWGSTSDASNYLANIGSTPTNYYARLFNILALAAEYTPYIYGLTATPTNEQRDLLKVNKQIKYLTINLNNQPKRNDGLYTSAWLGDVTYTTDTRNSFTSIWFDTTVLTTMDGIRDIMDVSRPAETTQIFCEIDSFVKDRVTPDIMAEKIERELKIRQQWRPDKIIIDTAKGIYFWGDNGNKIHISQAEVFTYLNDPTHPAQYYLCINKGTTSINIPGITYQVHLSSSKIEDGNGNYLLNNMLQKFGRAKRHNLPISNEEFTEKYNRDIVEYAKTLDDIGLETLLRTNTFNIKVPDTTYHRKAVEKLLEEVLWVSEAETLLKQKLGR